MRILIRRQFEWLASVLVLIVFQICTSDAFMAISNRISIPARRKLCMSARPITYTAVKCPWKPGSQLLIKDSEKEYLELAKLFTTEQFEVAGGQSLVSEWIVKGVAFWEDKDGLSKLYASEERNSDKENDVGMSWEGAGQYINFGTKSEPVYMDRVMYYRKAQSGLLRKGPQDPHFVQELVDSGEAFTYLEHLFRAERQANRALDIALRLKANYSISSPEWQRWTNYTEKSNSTSLLQAIGHYFAEHSVADVGLKKGSEYVPKRGYVGTLAPGETYPDAYPLEDHPKKILHPWPAFQEIPMHVRWPSNHPLIPNYLLFLAQNNMLLLDEWDEITKMLQDEWLEETGQQPIVWGSDDMLGLDAHRIATEAAIGRCYLPEEQIPHGGMVFNYGEKIPFYNPDHGPTSDDWQVAPDIPPQLRPLVEQWPSPYREIDAVLHSNELVVGETQRADQLDEEQTRRAAVQQLLNGVDVNPYPNNVEFAIDPGPDVPAWMTDDPAAEAVEVERRLQIYLEQYYARRAKHELGRDNAALIRQEREAPPELQRAGPPRLLEQEYVEDDEMVGEYTQDIDFNMLRTRIKHEIQGERIKRGHLQGRSPAGRPRLKYFLDAVPIEEARYQENKMWAELQGDSSYSFKTRKQRKQAPPPPQVV